MGFPIRKSTDQRVFAPPRSLSQRITSFIACACQGIHQLPLRHLIILIANAHRAIRRSSTSRILCGTQLNGIGLKRPASRDLLAGAVRQPIIVPAIERRRRRTAGWRNANKSSLHDVKQNRQQARSSLQTLLANDQIFSHQVMVEPDGIEPTTSCLQSRRSPS